MMVKVLCDRKPLGDIRQRQPKHPGQKAAAWNAPPQTTSQPPQVRWANSTKGGLARCTHCGHVGHQLAGFNARLYTPEAA